MLPSERIDYIEKRISETETALIKCTNDKKYFSLQRLLNFLKNELVVKR